MSDDKSISLVDLGKLSKPADTLIKKVSTAVGGIFKPWQIKRVAKAEAGLIKAKSELEITDLHHRAMHRFVEEEEAKRQENMEAITEKALPQLEDHSAIQGTVYLFLGTWFTVRVFWELGILSPELVLNCQPGKPTQNAFIESLNGKFRNECLNQHWFRTLDEARQEIDRWREHYNNIRLHSSPGYLLPVEFTIRAA